MVRAWRTSTPRNFVFAWKASRFITHWKRLRDNCANSIELMETRLQALGPKLGPVLFQLPGNFEFNYERLERFIAMLPTRHRYAFEFRHASWYDGSIYKLLAAHDISLCLADHHLAPAPLIATARHVYVRGHGPEGRYRGNYSEAALRTWARQIKKWRRENREVFVYFDNDQNSAAPADAARLTELLEGPRQGGRRKIDPRRRFRHGHVHNQFAQTTGSARRPCRGR